MAAYDSATWDPFKKKYRLGRSGHVFFFKLNENPSEHVRSRQCIVIEGTLCRILQIPKPQRHILKEIVPAMNTVLVLREYFFLTHRAASFE